MISSPGPRSSGSVSEQWAAVPKCPRVDRLFDWHRPSLCTLVAEDPRQQEAVEDSGNIDPSPRSYAELSASPLRAVLQLCNPQLDGAALPDGRPLAEARFMLLSAASIGSLEASAFGHRTDGRVWPTDLCWAVWV